MRYTDTEYKEQRAQCCSSMQVINIEEDGSNAGAEAAMAGAAEGVSITALVLDFASDDSGGAEAAEHEPLEVVTLTGSLPTLTPYCDRWH